MRRLGMVVVSAAVVLTVAVSPVSALNVQSISILYGLDRTNGTADTYWCDVEVVGTGITHVVFQDQTTAKWGSCTYDAGDGKWYYDDEGPYATLALFNAAHANPTTYKFWFNQVSPGVYQDWDSVPYSVTPPAVVPNITFPLHNATDVVLDPLYQWTSMASAPGVNLLGMGVYDDNDDEIYENWPETNTAKTTWPEAGPLNPGQHYWFKLGGAAYAASAQTTNTLSDAYTLYGVWAQCNSVGFTTAIPEPMSLLLLGTGFLVLVGWRRRLGMR